MATFARPSYQDIIFSVKSDVNENDRLTPLSYDTMKVWILEAQERITRKVSVSESRTLRLIQNQVDYPFQDSTVPVAGTGTVTTNGLALTGSTAAGAGTITTSGVNVTGVGTSFITQLKIGNYLIAAGQAYQVVKINSQTSLTLAKAFSSDLIIATAYTYSTTKFTFELVSGSVIVANAQTWTVDTVTDGYNATLKAPNATEATANTFTIDTVVTEIPMRLMNILATDRIESSFHRQPKVVGIDYLLRLEKNDLINVYSQFNTPFIVAVYRSGSGNYFLKVYAQSDADKEMTFYSNVRIMPRLYIAEPIATPIQLNEDYEYAIRMYVEAMTYQWLKNEQKYLEKLGMFDKEITDLNARYIPNKTLDVVYQ